VCNPSNTTTTVISSAMFMLFSSACDSTTSLPFVRHVRNCTKNRQYSNRKEYSTNFGMTCLSSKNLYTLSNDNMINYKQITAQSWHQTSSSRNADTHAHAHAHTQYSTIRIRHLCVLEAAFPRQPHLTFRK
jgi:hypothetical protein